MTKQRNFDSDQSENTNQGAHFGLDQSKNINQGSTSV